MDDATAVFSSDDENVNNRYNDPSIVYGPGFKSFLHFPESDREGIEIEG